MKLKAISLSMLLFILVFVFASCSAFGSSNTNKGGDENQGSENENTVVVSIASGEHYTVISANPINVKKGESATFTVEIEEGYKYISSVEGAEYENGVLTIPNILYPTTVTVKVEKQTVIVTPGGGEGNGNNDDTNDPNPNPEPEPVYKTVELSAEPMEGYHFICWTLDVTAKEGGRVFSEEAEGSFNIPVDSEPVANYAEDGVFVILYRTNGGTTADGKDFYYQTFSAEHFLMPNTIYQNGTFVREGYVLMRYTEKEDGSGEYTTLGGKIEPGKNGFNELWLMWGKETVDFMDMSIYENDDGEEVVAVDFYRGSEANVVIPEEVELVVDGENATYKVEKICAEAFSYSSIETLVLPASIVTVEDKAFSHLNELKELTIHDNILQISDDAFYDCPNLQTCYLNAGRAPTHAGSGEGLFVVKYERLRMAAARGEKKIVIVSGSSSIYGFYAEQMQNAFNNEYTVVNHGTNASASTYFYINAYMSFFGEGDIIIQAPETTSSSQLGDTQIVWRILRECECMYEIISYVDMREYYGLFDSLAEFNQTVRNTMEDSHYESWRNSYNEYSDLTTNIDKFDYQTSNPGGSKVYNLSLLTDERIENLNTLNERLQERGTTMYMSFAPVNVAACNSNYTTAANMAAYVEFLESNLDYDVISDPADYLLEQKYFNNSDYHPGTTGAIMRTEQLIADLKEKLISEGIWSEKG